MSLLDDYALSAELYDPKQDMQAKILEDNATLEDIASVWKDHQKALIAIIGHRMQHVEEMIIKEARPQDVPMYRQALVELGNIFKTFEKYSKEYGRRAKPAQPAKAEGKVDDAKPVLPPEPNEQAGKNPKDNPSSV